MIKLTGEQARFIVWGEDEDWKMVKGTKEIVDQGRWSTAYEAVFLHIPSGKYYLFGWSRGSTECQDEKPYEYDKEVDIPEVVEKEVLVKQWVVIN